MNEFYIFLVYSDCRGATISLVFRVFHFLVFIFSDVATEATFFFNYLSKGYGIEVGSD